MIRKLFLILSFNTFFFTNIFAALTGGFDYTVYRNTDQQPFIETYLWIEGNSLFYKKENNQKQAQIEVTFIITQKGEVKFYDKYGIRSKSYGINDSIFELIYDLKRFPAINGNIEIEMIVKDLQDPEGLPIEMKDTVLIEFDEKNIHFSNILLLSNYQKTEHANMFSKGGYDMIPSHSSLFEDEQKKIKFYAEIYNTEKVLGVKGKYLLSYYIENQESGRQLEEYTYRKREIANTSKQVLTEIDITNLASGNYNLVIEVRDSINQLKGRKKTTFTRVNKYYQFNEEDYNSVEVKGTFISRFDDLDSLKEFIKCVKPIADDSEYQYGKNVMKNGDPTMMKRFIYAFWLKRNPQQPAQAFADYWAQVMIVNKNFGTLIQRGYETDRGRVYLRYGAPNSINQRYNEPSAYPYEIWQYWQIRSQTNVRFVFYNKDEVSNDFALLHSDLRGEINNRQWEMFLFQRNNVFDVDQNNINNQFGNWSNDLYRNPR